MILLSLQNSSTYRPWPVPLSWGNGVPIQQNCFILTSWYHFPDMVWTPKRYCWTTKPRHQGSSSSLKFQIEPFSKFQNCDFFGSFEKNEWRRNVLSCQRNKKSFDFRTKESRVRRHLSKFLRNSLFLSLSLSLLSLSLHLFSLSLCLLSILSLESLI